MSKSLNSPTARLLQSSRLFSLPRPLPQPTLGPVTSTGTYRSSDTATLPYPTLQAIATPASSHHRGDWGLKRPLPTKATRHSSTPAIRISAVDNATHITDFASAGDHVQTEAKWREMGIPLLQREQRTTYSGSSKASQSVYDDNLDNTDTDTVKLGHTDTTPNPTRRLDGAFAQSLRMKRWKFAGPSVSGMSTGDFELYIAKNIAGRKAEFRDFLLDRLFQRRVHDEEQMLRSRGDPSGVGRFRREELRQETLDNFEKEQKRLRDEHAVQHLGSDLTAAICEFLDLPGIQGQDAGVKTWTGAMSSILSSVGAADGNGPSSTHPGAGLSHIRSNAFMENHPLWGPQAHRTPVKARVVRPRNSAIGTEYQAKLGVGGIVANDPIGSSQRYGRGLQAESEDPEERYLDSNEMTSALDADLPGGNKIWVQPEYAHIDEHGRIMLHVSRGDREAIAVRRNKVEPIHEARSASLRGSMPVIPPGTAGNANYGYGLPDRRAAHSRARPNISGFDAELGRTPQQGKMREREAAAKIRELMREGGAADR